MSPIAVGSSYSNNTLKTGEAKLWILLVGVNEYQDSGLPSLRYPAVDCQGLKEALVKATKGFPNKEVIIHHDFAAQSPTLETIRSSLQRIVSQTQSQDSILLYFSGHGMLDPHTQQAVLCLADTRKDDLLSTGLGLQELLQMLEVTAANQQIVCLDTCHSGDFKLLGGNAGSARDGNIPENLFNSAPTLMKVLQQRASKSKGFCALLSCDQGQQSWEFPELGHGLFTYYLMQGLLGEAADSQGIIEADGLYKYVYRQTLQYIDKLNHQLRLINQQKLDRGDSKLHPEYPLQTPKRIVEGVGELILGFKPDAVESHKQRRALVIDGFANKKTTTDLSRLFAGSGNFEVELFPQQGQSWSEIRRTIQEFLHKGDQSTTQSVSHLGTIKNTPTSLLYLRGHIEEIEDGEAWLVLGDGMRLSRSWLRHELRRATKSQQIIILDCPEATTLNNWIEDLHSGTEQGQCIIAGASIAQAPELFSQTLLETLSAANPQAGLPIAKWITQLQTALPAKGVKLDVCLSATQAVIDILPGNINIVFQQLNEVALNAEKQQEEQKNLLSPDVNNLPTVEFPYLPSSQSLIEQPVSVTAPITADYVTEAPPQLNFQLDSQQYSQIEYLLKLSVGSIAPAILKKTLKKATNSQELVGKLTTHLLPEKQQSFQQQAIAILEQSTVESQSKSDNSSRISPEFISKCERELAYAVGPIARFVVQDILKSYPQISLLEFVKKLSAGIRDPQKALEFENRILGN
ncbi:MULTISPECIES: caspase family protein [Calothrix]|uniref:Caspase family protein n=2 Tax=Calothrix TaxID=1186 RepID=A0ABR8A9R8_9CYAN|nr:MULTISPECIES: caspase domain-containing protein [Calothrix]MBD2195517.1 caspase family protein [Calothrix parietina FACHB-288]MBD2228395.1 caspase family protein [Calothrix anomala FACHB-343]